VLASVPARRGRLGGTATTTTGDSRRGTGNGGQQVCRASRVLFFVGEVSGGLLPVLPVLPGGCSCVLENLAGERGKEQPVAHHSQPQPGHRGSHQRTAQEDGEARAEASLALLAAPEEVGAAADTEPRGSRHHDHRRQGCQGRRTATTVGAPAPTATGPLPGGCFVLSRRSTVC
jgi:hypothetical protein